MNIYLLVTEHHGCDPDYEVFSHEGNAEDRFREICMETCRDMWGGNWHPDEAVDQCTSITGLGLKHQILKLRVQ